MPNLYDVVTQLTSQALPALDRSVGLNDFADELGWRPSDRLEVSSFDDIATAHLVVEHGLENTAVISFLRRPWRFADLNFPDQKRLLSISYNNLVDWHLQVQSDEVVFVYNRSNPPQIVDSRRISRENYEALRSKTFEGIRNESYERVSGKKVNPNLPALDEALITTISHWKKILSAELGYSVPNEDISSLFNTIIFSRAVEDNLRHYIDETDRDKYPPVLLEEWAKINEDSFTVRGLLKNSLARIVPGRIPEFLIEEERLEIFDEIHRQTVFTLISDFYQNRYAPYQYDFSLISKHALSRIYEHYVSILRLENTPQPTLPLLFPYLQEEERDKAFGSIYTPQYIARFFARYLREQMSPLSYRQIKSIDPASGSGIFLRTLAEMQCDPAQDGLTSHSVRQVFNNLHALDVDNNACQAVRLSLSLLHLILTNHLPDHLNVINVESIYYDQERPELHGTYDAVLANPPFVSISTQSEAMRERISTFLGKYASGRIDLYLAFLKIGLDLLKPGGFGLFVLPHSFLLSSNAGKMRRLIYDRAWIRCLADLSAIRVFGDVGSYVVLLIMQKKTEVVANPPEATIVKCQDFVGRALQDVIENHRSDTGFYSIYDVGQDIFAADSWNIVTQGELMISQRLSSFPTLDNYLDVREGFVTGADDIFIVQKEQIPAGEGAVFVPFLPDKEMQPFVVPRETGRFVFYPYVNGFKIGEHQLKSDFRRTWEYLDLHRAKLEARRSVRSRYAEWWEPVRSRPPQRMLRPKIVSPHLVLLPRFSIDVDGRYAISHAPLLYPKDATGLESDLLRYFVAVLNSSACYWYISAHSHKYGGGYTMLEPKTLRRTPVPDPTQVSRRALRQLIRLVDRRLVASGSETLNIEQEIDEIVSGLYQLAPQERRAIGMTV